MGFGTFEALSAAGLLLTNDGTAARVELHRAGSSALPAANLVCLSSPSLSIVLMRQSQAIALAAVVVAASLLLAFISWIPSRSTVSSFSTSMSDEAKPHHHQAHHHHHINQAAGMVGGKGAEQPVTDEVKQVRILLRLLLCCYVSAPLHCSPPPLLCCPRPMLRCVGLDPSLSLFLIIVLPSRVLQEWRSSMCSSPSHSAHRWSVHTHYRHRTCLPACLPACRSIASPLLQLSLLLHCLCVSGVRLELLRQDSHWL